MPRKDAKDAPRPAREADSSSQRAGLDELPNPALRAAASSLKASPSSSVEPTQAPPKVEKIEETIAPFEQYLPWAILALSLITRYWAIAEPAGVVFDEYHFGRFVNQYCAGTYLFDIHPPLGKLTLFFVGKIFGYDHTVCSYNAIQDEYKPECKFWVLRMTAAFFGSFTAPLMYYATRGFGGGLWASILCASFFIFDNLNLIEDRLVLIDSQLIFYCALSLVIAQQWWVRINENFDARSKFSEIMKCDVDTLGSIDALRSAGGLKKVVADLVPAESGDDTPALEKATAEAAPLVNKMLGEFERNLWCLAVGFACSSAISIKWTGLATPGLIGVESFFGFFFLRKKAAYFTDLLKVLAVALTLYTFWFAVHFSLLPNSGDGDAFMRIEFQRTLFNNSNYDPLAEHPGFFATFVQLNQEMLSANARIELRHNWESVWWEWPGNLRGLLYYSKDFVARGISQSKLIYLLGNPGVIWLVGVCVVLCVLASACYLRYKHDQHFQLHVHSNVFSAIGYCLWVYILNLLPYILVNRSAFIYHYMPALMYAEIMSALLIEQLVSKRYMPIAMKVLAVVIISCFFFYAPWVYGTPLTMEGHARRRWLKRWD